MEDKHPIEQMSELFGSYKAEWLREQIFELFTEPSYFPGLTTPRPVVLIGGRGTGKTTVLRSLSYEGRFALSKKDPKSINDWPYYGFYYRVNTNRVTALRGEELPESVWEKLFAHYLNLVLGGAVLQFLLWYYGHFPSSPQLTSSDFKKLAASFDVAVPATLPELAAGLEEQRIRFENFINNLKSDRLPALTMSGAPVDSLFEVIGRLPQFQGKAFFFLIDEYENFLNYQQVIVNTLIKHSGQAYSFKIGVKELGWRTRTTLNANEQLVHPADYIKINIWEELSGDKFEKFALEVCNARISRLPGKNGLPLPNIRNALPELRDDDEAQLLGVEGEIGECRNDIRHLHASEQKALDNLSPLEIYFAKVWAEGSGESFIDVLRQRQKNPKKWRERYDNYKFATLFTIKRGKGGIRKFYAGWDVYVQLASANIRYLMELVHQSLLLHLRANGDLAEPIPYDTQTRAAQAVGKKNLGELEGLEVNGADLTKLLLGLGRIFEVMASQPVGHAPEVTQFYLSDQVDNWAEPEALNLIKLAVMNLALVRSTGNKPIDETDTKAFNYSVHPIFAPFFVFSYRKKRKMAISAAELVGLVRTPKDTIREIIRSHHRQDTERLPEQMALFEAHYGRNS